MTQSHRTKSCHQHCDETSCLHGSCARRQRRYRLVIITGRQYCCTQTQTISTVTLPKSTANSTFSVCFQSRCAAHPSVDFYSTRDNRQTQSQFRQRWAQIEPATALLPIRQERKVNGGRERRLQTVIILWAKIGAGEDWRSREYQQIFRHFRLLLTVLTAN